MTCEDPRRKQLSRMVAGELDATRAGSLLEHIEGCEDCSQELDFFATTLSELELNRAHAVQAPTPSKDGDSRKRLAAAVRTAALAVALLSAALVWYSLPEDAPANGGSGNGRAPLARADVSFALAAPPFVAHSTRSNGTPGTAAFHRAMRGYQEGDWNTAARELLDFLETRPDHAPARFYRAVALESAGSSSSAIAEFERVTREGPSELREHALWRLAHLRGRMADEVAARERLRELLELDGDFAQRAREKLQELERPAP